MEKISNDYLVKKTFGYFLLIFSVIFMAFWFLSEHSGNYYGNSLYGPLWDAPGYGEINVENLSKSYGMDFSLCNSEAFKATNLNCRRHWFGDFYVNYMASQLENPWRYGENPNFALSNSLSKLLSYLAFNKALALYLILSSLAMLLPMIHAVSRRKNSENILYVALVMVSYPFLFTLDRANAQAFVPVLIYFSFISQFEGKNNLSIIYSSILFAWKLHTWPIAILLFSFYERSQIIKTLALTVFLIIFPIVFWPDSTVYEYLKGWYSTIRAMGRASGPDDILVWRNQSLVGMLSTTLFLSGVVAKKKMLVKICGLLWIGFVLPIVRSKNLPFWLRLFAVASVMVMAVPRGYGYGSNFMLCVIPFLIYSNERFKINGQATKFDLFLIGAIPVLLGFILAPDFALSLDPEYLRALSITAKNISNPLSMILIVCISYHLKRRSH